MTSERRMWGGRRLGSGRPNLSLTPNHMKRPKIKGTRQVLITHQLNDELPSISPRKKKKLVTLALQKTRWKRCELLSFKIRSQRIYLLIETKGHRGMVKSLQGFSIRFAKSLNKYINDSLKSSLIESSYKRRSGGVFHGRYRLRLLPFIRRKRRFFFRKFVALLERPTSLKLQLASFLDFSNTFSQSQIRRMQQLSP